MNKVFLATAMAVMAFSGLNAQVENRAVNFTEAGTINCGAMPDLNDLSSYSLQFWFNPNQWKQGATILSRGEDFSVKLGEAGLLFTVGDKSVNANHPNFKEGEWNQVTLICKDGSAIILINGEKSSEGSLSILEKSDSPLILGGGYSGLLDEVRIWNEALNDEMEMFDYFTNNTLNKWNPMWDNLVVYYKMDQKDCPYLVDYKGIENPVKEYDNHGILSEEGVEKVLTDIPKMPYLVNAAYTANERFYDRLIPQDQYLLSNEIIILGADCIPETGGIKLRTPNNHANLEGVKYLSSYEGKEGVVEFDGNKNTRLTLPMAAWSPSNSYNFETWLYLDEWTPGAYIVRKESEDQTKGIAILLGDEVENPTLKVRINGGTYQSFKLSIPLKTWFHLAVEPTVQPSGIAQAFNFYINGESKSVNKSESEGVSTDNVPSGNEQEYLYIGEGIKGKMDETCLWNKIWGNSIKSHMTNIPVPSLTKNVNVSDMSAAVAYLRYDNPENPGFSTHSQDNWANIIRGAYEGYYGGKIVLSVNGSNGNTNDFYAIINDDSKRKAFAQNLADLSKNYDGVELDLEWCYNASGTNSWANYALMADEIRKVLPEDKTFRISMHNVSYSYPINKINNVTGFTIQQYGPQNAHWTFNSFKNYLKSMQNYGLPASKLMTSYATTTSRGFLNGTAATPIKGVKDGFLEDYIPTLSEPENELMTKDFNGYTYSYMSPVQVYKRAKYTRENGFQGIFYWDMGNDLWNGTTENPIPHNYNISKYCSFGLNANCDKIITNLNINHYGESNSINKVEVGTNSKKVLVFPSPAENVINVSLSNDEIPEEVLIYSISGALMEKSKKRNVIDVNNLISGIYMLTAIDLKGTRYTTKFIKR